MRLLTTIFGSAARGRVPRLPWVLVALLGLGFAAGETRAQEGRELEYEVKAAFLLKFTMFVQWPTNAVPPDVQAPFVVGILGADPFGERFDQSVKNEKVNGRVVQIRRAREAADLLDCQVVFISASEAVRVAELIAAFRGRPVLTVADAPGFAGQGGMIGFFKESGKVRFEINATAMERTGLKASSKLLQVGRRITERSDSQG